MILTDRFNPEILTIVRNKRKVFENDIFDSKVLWMNGFCWFLRSVMFVARFLDRFLGYDVCLR